ncbi:FmdB family zinc ribbon protein [Gracilimonas sp. Q87]|uniref:FmdB family zinc ribbon protein n=1 Tax=Gracilimonas sp. Q87 TaxID=3384766 RepID=UPI0039844F3D
MPKYIYKREDGTKFEKIQSMKDDALSECPTTGQPCRRVITGGVVGPEYTTNTRKPMSAKEVTQKQKDKITTLGSDYLPIQERQRKRFEKKKAERERNGETQ